jgi:hypothetical protein
MMRVMHQRRTPGKNDAVILSTSHTQWWRSLEEWRAWLAALGAAAHVGIELTTSSQTHAHCEDTTL